MNETDIQYIIDCLNFLRDNLKCEPQHLEHFYNSTTNSLTILDNEKSRHQ